MSIITRVSKKTGIKPDDINIVLDAFCDEISWDEIDAFHKQSRKGQSIYEDAGGYIIRCIKALFSRQEDKELLSYRDAAKRLVEAGRIAP